MAHDKFSPSSFTDLDWALRLSHIGGAPLKELDDPRDIAYLTTATGVELMAALRVAKTTGNDVMVGCVAALAMSGYREAMLQQPPALAAAANFAQVAAAAIGRTVELPSPLDNPTD